MVFVDGECVTKTDRTTDLEGHFFIDIVFLSIIVFKKNATSHFFISLCFYRKKWKKEKKGFLRDTPPTTKEKQALQVILIMLYASIHALKASLCMPI